MGIYNTYIGSRKRGPMLKSLFGFFSKEKDASVCLIGEVNTGKSTLANRIAIDFTGKSMSTVSNIKHETRKIVTLEHIKFSSNGKNLDLTLVDTPGIATSIDYKNFVKEGMDEENAIIRAKEATAGIIEAIKFMEEVDIALLLMDATKTPFDQVSLTLMGTLEMNKKKTIIVANKSDLPEAKPSLIQETFPQHKVVPISALHGIGIANLYDVLAEAA